MTVGLVLGLAIALSLAAPPSALANASTPVVVVPARIQPELAALAPGFALWVERRLAESGVTVRSGTDVRTAFGITAERSTDDAKSTRETLDVAEGLGIDRVVLIDLALEDGRIDVLLRVHRASGGKLEGAGRAVGPANAMAKSALTALERIIPTLGLETPKAPISAPFTLGALSRRAAALESLDHGFLARAWDATRDDATPDGGRIREEIDLAAADPALPKLERARLLAARGDAETAWRSILREASEQLYHETPEADVLIVAGEIHLARGKPHEARAYFERAIEVAPDRVEPILGLGQALSGAQDPKGAHSAFERASTLSKDPTRAAELMTRIPELDPASRARAHLMAAEKTRADLDLAASLTHWNEAMALDPTLAPVALERAGDLQLVLGENAAALESYRGAMVQAPPTADLKRGEARALIGLRDGAGAEGAYKAALELERGDPTTLRELGALYADTQRLGEARQLLEQAVSAAPDDPAAHRSLARVLHAQGELEAAIPHLALAEHKGGSTIDTLRELAAIQRELSRPIEAEATLERAIREDPTAVVLRKELAAVYQDLDRGDDAARQMQIVEILGGTEVMAPSRGLADGPAKSGSGDGQFQYLDALITSFGMAQEGHDHAVLLPARHAMRWKSQVLDWLMPRTVDLKALEAGLAKAIDPLYDRMKEPVFDERIGHARDQLVLFEDRASLDAAAVATVNSRLDTHVAFVAVVERGDLMTRSRCPSPDQLHVEVRRLSGHDPATVQILSNEACVAGAEASLTTWNHKAAGVWFVILALLVRPVIRGFGKVDVRVKLPNNTRALFSISLTRRPRKIKSSAKTKGDSVGEINQRLRSLGRKERPLKRDGRMTFNWVPARKAPYYVTLHGPLYHSVSEQLIGDFLEERTVVVTRGRMGEVRFDLEPKDCPVEVMVYSGKDVINGAQVALRGDRTSVRFTSKGGAFLYLPKGRHTLVAGSQDRAAEREIKIDSFEPMPLVIDLANEDGLVFRDCPEAVTPFLEGNFETTALALRAAGQDQLATRMQARAHESKGDVRSASKLLEELGEVTAAADLLARSGSSASASLYEEAGEFARAAEVHQKAGDMQAAARAWEAAFDFENALECYRQLGDEGKVLELLEKTGEFFEAGRLSIEQDEVGRAIQNLQQVESRHPHYGDSCRLLGEILAEQGNRDFALEKFDEAREVGGLEAFPLQLRERYGRMLEDAGRLSDAVAVLSSVRREDIGFRGVDRRITEIKQRMSELETEQRTRVATQAAPTGSTEPPAPTQASIDDRYELMGQLGAGGMGVVYKAKDKQLGRMVALKRLPENLSQHPAALKFFEREARSAAALNHPNIVTVYDAGMANGQYFITMEMLQGTPLDAVAKKHGALPPMAVAQLGIQIATGLHFAHRNKIIHRDIKPANLFLTKEKIVKIMDFGLAKMVEEARKGATVIGGTPFYLAPEQAAGGEVDHRADLYALGITLYQLASGALPFTEGDVAYHHRHTPPPDPREFNASLPAPLAELILKLIEKDPADRMQKAADVVRGLQAYIDQNAGPKA